MTEVNSDNYEFANHESLLYQIAMEFRQLQADHAGSLNERKMINVSFDIDNQKIRLSVQLDAYISFEQGSTGIAVNPKYTYTEPTPEETVPG